DPLGRRSGPIKLTGDALAGRVLLCAPAEQPSREATNDLLAAASAEPAARWEFEGLTTIAALVANRTGVAILPRLALHQIDPDAAAAMNSTSLLPNAPSRVPPMYGPRMPPSRPRPSM